jgi:hypothetical protein
MSTNSPFFYRTIEYSTFFCHESMVISKSYSEFKLGEVCYPTLMWFLSNLGAFILRRLHLPHCCSASIIAPLLRTFPPVFVKVAPPTIVKPLWPLDFPD